MDALRCPPGDSPVTHLSGGERRRVALCKLLLSKPDLLLLDEPTNHLDAESVQWLESHLAAYAGAVLAVTHDRYFLDNVAEWILEIDRGRTYPLRGQLLDLPGEEGRARRRPGPQGREAAQAPGRRAGVGAVRGEGAPGQEQVASGPLRGDGHRGREDPEARLRGDPDPAGPASGQRGGRGQPPRQGLRRPAADQGPVVLAAAQRHHRRDRSERRRQDDAVQDDRRASSSPTPGR